MKKIYFCNKALLIALLLLSTGSCNDNDLDTTNEHLVPSTKSMDVDKNSIHFDLTENIAKKQLKSLETISEEDKMKSTLLALGASDKMISDIFQVKKEKIILNPNDNPLEYTEINSLEQLKQLGINEQTLKERTKLSGIYPDGILISGKQILGKVNKGMYDYYKDDKLYLVKSTNAKVLNDFETKYSHMIVKKIVNDSDTEQSGSFSYTYEIEKGISYEQSHSVGTSFSMELKTKINAILISNETTFKTEISYNYTNTHGNHTVEKKTQTSQADYKIPKKSSMNIVFIFPTKTAKIRYNLPITFLGTIATNYKKRVNSPYDGSKRYFINQDFNRAIIQPIYGNNFYIGEVDVDYKEETVPDIIYLKPTKL
ncbi:MAG: hypothetical protein J6581_02435 [Apibacter sp.]|nr:hypothetical protein [Apibacter sp.]